MFETVGNGTVTISDLDREERRFVIRTLVRAVGAHQELTRLGGTRKPVPREDVLNALNLPDWLTSEATEVELAWSSKPLCHPDFPRLRTYSVFWSLSSDLQLWIGETPQKPRESSSFLCGPALMGAIMRLYRIELASQRSTNGFIGFAKRNGLRSLPYVLLAVVVIGAFASSYFRRGLVLWTFILPLTSIGTFLFFRYGPKLLGYIAFDLVAHLLLFFGLPYLVWKPSEHLPYGSDVGYPFIAALAAATVLGMNVMLFKAVLEGEEESLVDMFRSRFRSLRRSLALASVVATAGYGAFLVHSFAVHQVFVEGNHIFLLLMVFGVVGLYAVIHQIIRQ